jgi:hypothetical protein
MVVVPLGMAGIVQNKALKMRQAEKKAARKQDVVSLEQGVSPEEIQRKNSMFLKRRIQRARIHNLADVVGE